MIYISNVHHYPFWYCICIWTQCSNRVFWNRRSTRVVFKINGNAPNMNQCKFCHSVITNTSRSNDFQDEVWFVLRNQKWISFIVSLKVSAAFEWKTFYIHVFVDLVSSNWYLINVLVVMSICLISSEWNKLEFSNDVLKRNSEQIWTTYWMILG